MKTITIPDPVIYPGDTRVTIADLVNHALLVDQRFNANGAGIRSGAKVASAIEGALVSFPLEDADYDRLLDAVENPQPMQGMPPYPARPASRLAPLIIAIKSAE